MGIGDWGLGIGDWGLGALHHVSHGSCIMTRSHTHQSQISSYLVK